MKIKGEPKKRKQKYSSLKQALEPRMVYDASVAVDTHAQDSSVTDTATPASTTDTAIKSVTATPQSEAAASSISTPADTSKVSAAVKASADASQSTSTVDTSVPANTDTSNTAVTQDFAQFTGPAKELVFIDSRVQNPQALLQGISSNAEVHFIDPTQDGINQVDAVLKAEQAPVSAIYILSHGSSGSIELGNTELTDQALKSVYANEIASWQSHLTSNANILLYGCDVAQGALGQQFVTDLSHIAGEAVAASTDMTGSAALGGNWNLEYDSGVITLSATDVFAGQALSNYGYLMAQPVVDLNGPTSLVVSDNFSSGTFSGGTSNIATTWSTPWTEFDVSYNRAFVPGGTDTNSISDPTAGNIVIPSVATGGTVPGLGTATELAILGHSVQSGDSIQRSIDLQAYTSGSLSISYSTAGLSSTDAIEVQVSNNGGVTFTTLGILANNTSSTTQTFDISNYLSTDTTIQFKVYSGFNVSDTQQFLLTNVAINASGNNYTGTFAEQTQATTSVPIVASNMVITDSGNITSATITSTNFQTSDVLAIGTIPSTITAVVNNTTGIVTLNSVSGSGASTADFQTAMEAITFNNPSPLLSQAMRSFNVTVTDAAGITSAPATSYIEITPYNYPTVINPQAITASTDATTSGMLFNNASLTAERTVSSVYNYDPDTLGLTAALVTQATQGTAVVNSNGTYTYTPNAGATGTDSFQYSLTSQAQVVGQNYQEWNATITTSLLSQFSTLGTPNAVGYSSGYNVDAIVKSLTGVAANGYANAINPNGLNDFVVNFTSTLNIKTAGTYTFYSGSDDGSLLYVDGQLVVNNDLTAGGHSYGVVSGAITLAAGLHTIDVQYYQGIGQEIEVASYQGADTGGLIANLSAVGTVLANATVTGTVNVTLQSTGPLIATGADVYALDNFATRAYSNNSGTINFAGNWVETNDGTASATSGKIQVTSSSQLQIQNERSGSADYITRSINLLAASGINPTLIGTTLSFNYAITNAEANGVQVQISSNGGSTWTTLDTLSSATSPASGSKSYNISAYSSATTEVRFMAVNATTTQTLEITNFRVDATQVNYTAPTYYERGTAVAIGSSTTAATNTDGNSIASAVVAITNYQAGDLLTYDNSVSGITAVYSNGTLILTGTNTSAQYALALQHVFYSSTILNPSNVTRTINVSLKDTSNITSNTAVTSIAVVDVNDPPVGIAQTVGTSLNTNYVFSLSNFPYTDPQNNALADVIITTVPSTSQGILQFYNGTSWTTVTAAESITVASITSGYLRFVPTAGYSGAATFTFQLQDNGSTANGGVTVDPTPKTFTVGVLSGPNTPPQLSSNLTLAPILENNLTPSGSSISALASGVFVDPDANSFLSGIAVVGNTANATTQGVWQYSTNGTTWYNVGTVGDNTTALALSAAADLRFVPVANYSGTPPSLVIRALDNTYSGTFTSGATLAHINSALNGGTSAIASSTNTISTSVTFLNTAPVLIANNPALNSISATNVNNSGQLVSTLISTSVVANESQIIDPDTGAVQGIAIISVAGSQGTWQYSLDGTTWINIPTVSVGSALLLSSTDYIRFAPNGTSAGSGAITYRAWDQTSGTVGTEVDTTLNGGSTAFSITVDTATIITASPSGPLLSGTNSAANYVENAATASIADSLITVTDSGSTTLASATVTVASNFVSGQDVLAFTNTGATAMGNITGSYNSTTGVMTLTSSGSTATLAQWQTALAAVTYKTTSTSSLNTTRAINFQVTDAHGLSGNVLTETLSVVPVSLAPVGTNNAFTITDNAFHVFAAADFGFTNTANSPPYSLLAVEITQLPTSGTLTDNGVTVTLNQFISVADINSGLLVYKAPASNGTSTMTFKVEDNGSTANGGVIIDQTARTITFTISGSTPAPVLTPIAPTLPGILENNITSTGETVASMVGSSISGVAQGIAVTATTTVGTGVWQYSTDGVTWTAFGTVSSTSSLLLAATDYVRFVPSSGSVDGAPTFTYRAWDQVTGTASTNGTPSKVSTSTNGGTTAFSSATDVATIQVANAAPTITVTGLNPTFNEVAGVGSLAVPISIFSSASVNPVETGQTITGITFTVSGVVDGANESIVVDGTTITLGVNTSGTTVTNSLAYSMTITSGTATITLTSAGLTSTLANGVINGITYRDTLSTGPTAGNRAFTITKIQDSGGIANGGINTTNPGITSTINVLNDTPTITSTSATSLSEGTNVIYTATATDTIGAAITYALTGADASKLIINSSTGVVSLISSGITNNATKSSYSFNIVATDDGGNLTKTQAVVVTITDVVPVITSSATASVLEGTTAIYTATATDAASGTTISYSLTGADAALLSINSSTGVVSLLSGVTNNLTKSSYNFNVVATDNAGVNKATTGVVVSVTDVVPVITSSATASLAEGTANIYTTTATDAALGTTITYSLTGTDASLLIINAAGVVSLKTAVTNNLAKSSYSFNVVATDNAGANVATQAVAVTITDVVPVITSSATASLLEGTPAIYTATATDA
ncbi:MAG: DUF4347 domain-containing protein, partial [Gammaproteobacteria bacterium]|nr:DUF4347 domain-containing protein [Gammaproteobacteria bacterium]